MGTKRHEQRPEGEDQLGQRQHILKCSTCQEPTANESESALLAVALSLSIYILMRCTVLRAVSVLVPYMPVSQFLFSFIFEAGSFDSLTHTHFLTNTSETALSTSA